jgi:hypothetical protein
MNFCAKADDLVAHPPRESHQPKCIVSDLKSGCRWVPLPGIRP